MKRQILYMATLALCMSATAQTFSGGTGTKADPWLISNVADLEELCRITDTPGEGDTQQTYGKYFRLTQDITEPFTSMIGLEGFFKGDFDGDGHCITLNINMPSSNYVGLFGTVKTGAVHDLAVRGNVIGKQYVGGIVANPTNGAMLYNLANYADVASSSTSLLACVGGVIGGIVSQTDGSLGGATISNCANYGFVTCSGSAVGGVIGYSGQAVGNTISDIANYGYVESMSTRGIAGTIGNPMWNDKVHRIANFGIVSSEDFGGCIGNANPTDLGEIFYDRQYTYCPNGNSNQERNTSELMGTQMQGTLGENWIYAEGLLPRPNMNGLESSSIAMLYATPVVLADGDRLGNVTKDFRVSTGNGVKWAAKNGLVEINNDGSVSLKGNGKETLTATLNGEERKLSIIVSTATGISNINMEKGENDSEWRNLNGQTISSPAHGIYIHNGKKVVIR